jgi:two-component system NarL family sensor kinase
VNGPQPLRRVPIESQRPIVIFAWARLGLTGLGVLLVLALELPYDGRLLVVVAGVGLPWSLLNLGLAMRSPRLAVSPLAAVGDVLVLVAVEIVAPEAYGVVRFLALTALAIHAHFQGARLGLALTAFAIVALVVPTSFRSEFERAELLALYEASFAAASLTTMALIGGFRTAESASRLRARDLARRTMQTEANIRRRFSESLHDGPVQELIGLEMALAAAHGEAGREGADKTAGIIADAQAMAQRNLRVLRDEMIDLGPSAFAELSYDMALERQVPVWQRRYGLELELNLDGGELPSELEGYLFLITQEAVVNAARHGRARRVVVTLRRKDGEVTLTIADDGGGFRDVEPLAPAQPGHIGLASIRERAELMRGELSIDSSTEGATVTVRAPDPGAEAS